MNILTHNYENLLKMFLKDYLNKYVNELCLSINDEKFGSKYVSMFSSIENNSRKLNLNILKEMFTYLDQNYKNSQERKSKYKISKSNVPRTITTLFGDLTFERTYYINKFDNSYHFWLDEYLGLDKYNRYDPLVRAKAIEYYTKSCQKTSGELIGIELSSILNLFQNNKLTIPRQTIHNWINDWVVPDYLPIIEETPDTIYIMADEKFIGCQDSDKDIMIKSIVTFEGVKEISKGRRKLINRHIINLNSKHPWQEFSDKFYKMYDYKKIKNIFLLGDGASWIKNGVFELNVDKNINVSFLLCKFHFKQAINRITTNTDERKILNLYFENNSKKEFLSVLNEMKIYHPERFDKIDKYIKYFINNYASSKKMYDSKIGSSMESHISHFVAYSFSSRPKGYSKKLIDNYLRLSNLKNNDINIFKTYLGTYKNNEMITINERNVDCNIYNHDFNVIPALTNNGNNTALNTVLNIIAN